MSENQIIKHKTIEHYQLDNLLWTTPIAQFWTATHKLLKKSFVLKKIKLQKEFEFYSKDKKQQPSSFFLAKIESSLLNLIPHEGSPKCHKLIRTTTSAYIVLDVFFGKSLKSFLSTEKVSSHQLIRLMTNIVSELEKFHSKGLAFYLLSVDNIFVEKNNKITFVDWTLARLKDSVEETHQKLLGSLCSATSFNIKKGSNHLKADLCSINSIFRYIVERYQPQILPKFESLFCQLSNQKETGLDLNFVIKRLLTISSNIAGEEVNTPTFSQKQKQIMRKNEENMNNFQLKRAKSNNSLQNQHAIENIYSEKQRPSVGKWSKEQLAETRSKSKADHKRTSSLSVSSKSVDQDDTKFIGKIILKRRGLAFFLISLSEALHERSPEISFMLLKKARWSLKSAQTQCDKLKEEDELIFHKISALVISEITMVESLLSKLKSMLFELKLVSDAKREFTNMQSMVNINYLQNKIKEFLRDFLGSRRNAGTFAETAELYYNLYMLTKTLECGSYELFWDKTFKKRCLSNGEYFQKERKLGLRYFKSKIEDIVNRDL